MIPLMFDAFYDDKTKKLMMDDDGRIVFVVGMRFK